MEVTKARALEIIHEIRATLYQGVVDSTCGGDSKAGDWAQDMYGAWMSPCHTEAVRWSLQGAFRRITNDINPDILYGPYAKLKKVFIQHNSKEPNTGCWTGDHLILNCTPERIFAQLDAVEKTVRRWKCATKS